MSYPPPSAAWPPPATTRPSPGVPPRFRGRALVATGAACGLLGLLVGTVTGAGLAGSAASGDGLLGGLLADPAADEVLDDRLPELTAFVEEQVGVGFTTPPEVTVLDDVAFERELLSAGGAQPQSPPEDDYAATVAALGLVDDAQAYDDYLASGFADSVTGFYDTAADTLWVRGTRWGPTVEVTVVHELVHALQDQVVDLDALTAATHVEDETYSAFTAIVEGHATVVEQAWVDAQGAGYEDELYAESDELYADSPGDPFGEEMSYLPYWMGSEAVLGMPDRRRTVLEVMAAPPRTMEQVWYLSEWRQGLPVAADPVSLAEPAVPEGAEVVDRGSVGSYALALLPVHPTKYATWTDGPVPGWAGDRYVTWTTDGEGSCTAVDLAFDAEEQARAYQDRLDRWQAEGGTLVLDGTTAHLTRCT